MEEFALPQRLSDPMHKVQARHLLMANFWINANHLWIVERLDKSERMTDGWQENIAPRFIRLWLDGKLDVIALLLHIRS